jgi:hypothetical protein
MVSEGGLDTTPCALLTPIRRGDHPMSERELMEILYARWEQPNFGCQPPN